MTEGPSAAGVLTSRTELDVELGPVTASLAESARQRAEQILSDAAHQTDATLSEARSRAETTLNAARASGAAAARRRALAIVADARREAREEVLGAQRLVYEHVRAQTLKRLRQLAGSPEAAALNERLAAVGRQRLGADATVTTPEGEIGVVAQRDGRRVNLTGDMLLERALANFGAEIAELWS